MVITIESKDEVIQGDKSEDYNVHQWEPFFGGNRAYSTARATVKAAKPHLNPFSSTSDRVTARAKPPEYLHASLLNNERQTQLSRQSMRYQRCLKYCIKTARCKRSPGPWVLEAPGSQPLLCKCQWSALSLPLPPVWHGHLAVAMVTSHSDEWMRTYFTSKPKLNILYFPQRPATK